MTGPEKLSTPEDVALVNLRLLREVGAKHVSGWRCPECDSWAFQSRQGRGALFFVCGFCGHDWLAQ